MRDSMDRNLYPKGNFMTFPLKLTQLETENYPMENKYLYPFEVGELQMAVEEECDKMEYDGSMMYDEFPDKVSVELMANNICQRTGCRYQEEISNRWMRAFVMKCHTVKKDVNAIRETWALCLINS